MVKSQGHKTSEKFQIQSRVQQGCIPFPLFVGYVFYTVYPEDVEEFNGPWHLSSIPRKR